MKERKSHGVQLLLRMVVRDPDGKIISDTGKKPAESWLIPILQWVYGMFNRVNVNSTDRTGAPEFIYNTTVTYSIMLEIDAGANVDTRGIVVGTGDTAVTNTDIRLDVQLTEGAGAGNITHGAQIVGSAAVVGPNVDMELNRSFTNNTGDTITVKEAGLYTISMGDHLHCIIRDVLGTPVDVPDMCSLTVYYTVRTTV